MTAIVAIDRDGVEHTLQAPSGATLMEVLRDQEMGVAALCGGMCSCATCHVYVADEWLARLPAMHSDEGDVLSDIPDRSANSRLACQIAVTTACDGLRVTVAPEA